MSIFFTFFKIFFIVAEVVNGEVRLLSGKLFFQFIYVATCPHCRCQALFCFIGYIHSFDFPKVIIVTFLPPSIVDKY
jgi:hypothetical protein